MDAQLINNDCLQALPALPEASVDLVFADPPFNLKKTYGDTSDDRPRSEYIEWCGQWMTALHRVLKPSGSLYLMTIQKDIWIFQQHLESMGMLFRNIIAWKNSSMPVKNRYCINYQPILYFTMSDKYTFNHDAEKHMSNAAMPWGRTNKGNLMIDQWSDIPFISGGCMASKEAILKPGSKAKAHPCQMPIALAERAIKFSSNEGDTVLDPFMGSGTTGVAAMRNKRKFVGIEQVEDFYKLSEKRIKELELPIL